MKKSMLIGVCALALLGAESGSAAIVNWAFTSGTSTSSTGNDGTFSATIAADGVQTFEYAVLGDGFLISSSVGPTGSGDTLTLTFSEPIFALGFDIGSLDQGNGESVVFGLVPTLTPLSSTDVDWFVGGPAVLDGMRVTWSPGSASTGRVSFAGLPGITSFTFAEEWLNHAIYYDNFTATIPEPTTALLLASGLAGLALRRRRRLH